MTPDADDRDHRARELGRLDDGGRYAIKIESRDVDTGSSTRWLQISADELARISDILTGDD